jgi:hypothetical protein
MLLQSQLSIIPNTDDRRNTRFLNKLELAELVQGHARPVEIFRSPRVEPSHLFLFPSQSRPHSCTHLYFLCLLGALTLPPIASWFPGVVALV